MTVLNGSSNARDCPDFIDVTSNGFKVTIRWNIYNTFCEQYDRKAYVPKQKSLANAAKSLRIDTSSPSCSAALGALETTPPAAVSRKRAFPNIDADPVRDSGVESTQEETAAIPASQEGSPKRRSAVSKRKKTSADGRASSRVHSALAAATALSPPPRHRRRRLTPVAPTPVAGSREENRQERERGSAERQQQQVEEAALATPNRSTAETAEMDAVLTVDALKLILDDKEEEASIAADEMTSRLSYSFEEDFPDDEKVAP